MAKFRKKPVVVEAAQWTTDHNMSQVVGVDQLDGRYMETHPEPILTNRPPEASDG